MHYKGWIELDDDGCLHDSQTHMGNALFALTGYRLPLIKWSSNNDLTKIAMRLSGKSEQEVFEILYGEEVIRKARPLPGAQKFVNKLATSGFGLMISTGRPTSQLDITIKMAARDYPEIHPEHIHCTEFSSFENRVSAIHAQKAKDFVEYNAVAIVEDSGSTANHIDRTVVFPGQRKALTILVDKPWNWDLIQHEGSSILRVGNWNENDCGWDTALKMITSL